MSSEKEEVTDSPQDSSSSQESTSDDNTRDFTAEVIETESENTVYDEEIANTEVDEEVQKINESMLSEGRADVVTPKPNRELKSILELSKEANLNTNIAHKRKSVEPGGRQAKKAETIVKRRSSTGSNLGSHGSDHKLVKVQYLDIHGKPKGVGVSSFSDIESPDAISDSEDSKETKDKDDSNSNTSKRKRESLADLNTGGAVNEHGKRSRKLSNNHIITMNNKKKDSFCWRCHHEDASVFCETCPRSFHQKCLRQSVSQPYRWLCPECVTILKAENLKQRSPAMREMTLEHLCGLLKYALKRMTQVSGCEPFINPVSENEFPEYKNYVVQPMDLTCLERNIKDNLYGSTQAFEADAKWMLHNSIIFNSYQSKLTSIAKSIMKICKQEMAEIENCATCYLNANTKKKTWFIEVCPKPHLLVWAKLKGFPYWPAKAMRSNSVGMVDVRFFGAHDRAWVPFKECFLFSLKDPNSNKQKRNDINESIRELKIHIENLKKVYGEFRYAPYRVLYEPDREFKQLKLMLPRYDPEAKVTLKPIKRTAYKLSTNGTTSPADEVGTEESQSDVEPNVRSSRSLSSELETNESEKNGSDYESEDEETEESAEQQHSDHSDKSCNFRKSNQSETLNSSNSSEDFCCSVLGETNAYVNSRTVRGGKVRMRGGFTNTSGKIKVIPKLVMPENDIKTRLSSEELEIPSKLSRRNSDQSVKSDSSRLSNISDKINKVDISENMEIMLGNDAPSLSISENLAPITDLPKDDPPELVPEAKRKPIVEVNFSANENTEFTISPQNKSRIADRLMKKLAQPLDDQADTATTLQTQTADETNELSEKCFSNLNQTATETDLLLEKFKHKGLTVLEEITELSPDTEIFETKKDKAKVKPMPNANTGKETFESSKVIVHEHDDDYDDDINEKVEESAPLTQQEINKIILAVHDESIVEVVVQNRDEQSKSESLVISSSDEETPESSKMSSKTESETSAKTSCNKCDDSQELEILNDSKTENDEKSTAEKDIVVSSTSEENKLVEENTNNCIKNGDSSSSQEMVANCADVIVNDLKDAIVTEANNQDEPPRLEPQNIQPASLQERSKRKRSSGSDKNDEVEEVNPLQRKYMKVVNIEDIKKKNLEESASNSDDKNSPNSKSILENRLNVYSDGSTAEKVQSNCTASFEHNYTADSDANSITIKSEPSSDDEPSDNEYMELKRKYLSALNISERMPDLPSKQSEIRTRSKTEERKFKIVDNLSRVIDEVATHYSVEHANEEITLTRIAKKKEIFIKPLSKMQVPKQRARKSFPMPAIKNVYPAQKKDSLKLSKSIPTPIITATPLKSPANTLAIVTKASETVNNAGNIMFLAQSPAMTNSLTILPPNQPITYSANMGNPILTMVQHPVGAALSNVFIHQTNLAAAPALTNSLTNRTETVSENESQNYIPQSGATSKTSTVNANNKSASNTETVTHTSAVSVPALAPLSVPINATINNTDPAVRPTDLMDELQTLNSFVPETLTRAISDIMCRAPPKLKPRPPGPLSVQFDEGLPSVAGQVTSKVNSISHRLSDYFRGMLVELLQEIGRSENPEAEITRLKLENEELKHKHAEEILEIKKNISSILKDIQKSLADERSRLVEETRSTCETECVKRVEEAKSKQWCANCSKEAQFYCCWNTSYCDYPCQQKHWAKHMSKCTQNIQSSQQLQSTTATTTSKQQTQPLVIRPTTAPKGFTAKALIAKPTKVFVNRSCNNKGSFNFVRTSSGNHITLVESTPGNYELVGNGGPISVGGKVITNIGKIKCGNVISVTSPSNAGSTAVTGSGQKAIVIAQAKQPLNSTPKPTSLISDEECE